MTKPSFQDYGTYDESAHPDLWDGVVGYWAPCLGPTGTRLHDVSRYNNWGTLTNMDPPTDWVIDGGQYALDFDGSNDTVTVPNATALNPETGLTLAAWMYVTGSGFRQIFAKASGTSSNQRQYGLYVTQQNTLGFETRTTSAIVDLNYGTVTLNTWSLMIGTWSASRGMEWWINGASVANLNNAGTIIEQTAGLSIGQFPGGFSTFSGMLDNLGIWNRALTANEIRRLYNLGRGGMLERRRRRRVYSVQADVVRSYLFVNRGQVIGGGTL